MDVASNEATLPFQTEQPLVLSSVHGDTLPQREWQKRAVEVMSFSIKCDGVYQGGWFPLTIVSLTIRTQILHFRRCTLQSATVGFCATASCVSMQVAAFGTSVCWKHQIWVDQVTEHRLNLNLTTNDPKQISHLNLKALQFKAIFNCFQGHQIVCQIKRGSGSALGHEKPFIYMT